jgi:hypothetical protein
MAQNPHSKADNVMWVRLPRMRRRRRLCVGKGARNADGLHLISRGAHVNMKLTWLEKLSFVSRLHRRRKTFFTPYCIFHTILFRLVYGSVSVS